MADTIGKCECINPPDKSSIDRIIVNDIDESDDKLTMLRRNRKAFLESGVNVDELSQRYETQKLELKRLLLRVRNTPDCK